MPLAPWWEAYPSVLREEEADLERLAGKPPVLNEELLRTAGVRQYELHYDHDGRSYPLRVTYSDLHPYFRVEVATGHRFVTHQHPFEDGLCLVRGGTWNWNVGETAAQFIDSQLPKLLAEQTETPDRPRAGGHVEPYVAYYTYAPGTAIKVDGGWPPLAECDHGTFVVGVDVPPNPRALRGTVLEIRDHTDVVLRRADPLVMAGYADARRITGQWCRLPSPPSEDDAARVLQAVRATTGTPPTSCNHLFGGVDVELMAAVFTDGIAPGIAGDAWVFAVRGHGPRPPQRGRVSTERERIGPYLARAVRAGRRDMAARVPALAALAEKKVVVVGAGAVGAPSVIEFAKAGVGALAVVEWDVIDAGNAPRWPLGFFAAGSHKLEGVHQLVRWQWPYTALELHNLRLGAPRIDGEGAPEWERLAAILEDADLVYDATAEVGVSYFLDEVAKEHNIPFVVVTATEGGWGGRVARFRPGEDRACWTCLMHHASNRPELIPPADPDPQTRQVWPAGCTDPTFTGTGFDIASVALGGVRLAVSTLCENTPNGYPPSDWDIAVFAFRSDVATLAGAATTFTLTQHPDCKPCQNRRSG